MSVSAITCPRCGLELSISDRAPRHLSCPRCLARLVNPAAPESQDTSFPQAPVPVIPLDRQVERDTRLAGWVVLSLLGLLTVAAIVTFAARDAAGGVFMLIVMAALGAVVAFSGGVRGGTGGAERQVVPPRPGTVLEYGAPRRLDRPPATVGAVAAGFFSSIGVCGLGVVILAATADYGGSGRGSPPARVTHALILAGVVAAVIVYVALTIGYAGRWRGFGPGATAGLVLGLLALGPCAACYLMTLG